MDNHNVRTKKNELGILIDQLYAARERRLKATRRLDELKESEYLAEVRVIAELQNAKLTKAGGRKASVSLQAKTVAQVDPASWREVFAYVEQHDAWDLLSRRINNAAFRERIADGRPVPGIKAISVLDLSIRKI